MECHEQKHHEQISLATVQISLSYSLYRCLVRTMSPKARHKAAGSALSVKLEQYLSRPDHEGHISFTETFHEGLPQDGTCCRETAVGYGVS